MEYCLHTLVIIYTGSLHILIGPNIYNWLEFVSFVMNVWLNIYIHKHKLIFFSEKKSWH